MFSEKFLETEIPEEDPAFGMSISAPKYAFELIKPPPPFKVPKLYDVDSPAKSSNVKGFPDLEGKDNRYFFVFRFELTDSCRQFATGGIYTIHHKPKATTV